MRKQAGFTIVEMMIAGVLSLLVALGLITLYLNSSTSHTLQQGLARLQENGRFSTYYLNRLIRGAGYQGCSNLDSMEVTNLVKDGGEWSNFNQFIYGYDGSSGTWSPALPANLSGRNIRAGTDVVVIRKASDLGVQLASDMTQPNTAILIANGTRLPIEQNEVIMITDCEVGDIFMVGNSASAASITHAANNNNSSPVSTTCPSNNNCLSKAYTVDAQVLKFEYFAIYVKDSGRVNNNGAAINTLVVQDVNGVEMEIADGVEDLQILYGVDTNSSGSADTYLTATAVEAAGSWENVKSVNVQKLLSTVENVNSQPQAFTFNGVTTTPADRMLRRDWSNFITLRNRSFP